VERWKRTDQDPLLSKCCGTDRLRSRLKQSRKPKTGKLYSYHSWLPMEEKGETRKALVKSVSYNLSTLAQVGPGNA